MKEISVGAGAGPMLIYAGLMRLKAGARYSGPLDLAGPSLTPLDKLATYWDLFLFVFRCGKAEKSSCELFASF